MKWTLRWKRKEGSKGKREIEETKKDRENTREHPRSLLLHLLLLLQKGETESWFSEKHTFSYSAAHSAWNIHQND